jgi:hypothetical protein
MKMKREALKRLRERTGFTISLEGPTGMGASSGGDMLAGVFLALQICEPPAEPL